MSSAQDLLKKNWNVKMKFLNERIFATLQHRYWQWSKDYKEWLVEGTPRFRSKSDHVRFLTFLISHFVWFLTHIRQDVEKMFDELDKNFDGQLSWQEFIGEETTIERAFKLFDENNDGTISKAVSEEKH